MPRTPASQAQLSALFFLYGYYPNDPRVRRQAEALAKAGWEVEVLCTSEDRKAKTWNLRGVRVCEVALVKTRGSIIRYLHNYLAITASFRRIATQRARAGRPVAVAQVATLPDFLIAAATPLRRVGTKVVLDFHEAMPEFFGSKFPNLGRWLARKALERLEYWSASQADGLMTVNDEIADRFEVRLRRRPMVIYNSPDESILGRPKAFVEDALSVGPRIFGYHGTFTSIYGLDLLLRACARLRQQGLAFKLHLVGSGPVESDLRAIAHRLGLGNVVVFEGRKPLERIPEFIRFVHIGVVPTRKDEFLNMSLGTKLLEYVHAGRPVVTSDLRAVQRVFSRDNTFFYFSGNSEFSLAESMHAALVAPPEELRRRVECALHAYRPISWDVMSKRYVGFLMDLLGGHS